MHGARKSQRSGEIDAVEGGSSQESSGDKSRQLATSAL